MQPPSEAGANGRDGRGRFTKGNQAGKGNPHSKQAQKLRSALFKAVTEDDITAIIQKLVERAKAGDCIAAREVLDRCVGKAVPVDFEQRIEELEEALLKRA